MFDQLDDETMLRTLVTKAQQRGRNFVLRRDHRELDCEIGVLLVEVRRRMAR